MAQKSSGHQASRGLGQGEVGGGWFLFHWKIAVLGVTLKPRHQADRIEKRTTHPHKGAYTQTLLTPSGEHVLESVSWKEAQRLPVKCINQMQFCSLIVS